MATGYLEQDRVELGMPVAEVCIYCQARFDSAKGEGDHIIPGAQRRTSAKAKRAVGRVAGLGFEILKNVLVAYGTQQATRYLE